MYIPGLGRRPKTREERGKWKHRERYRERKREGGSEAGREETHRKASFGTQAVCGT
jgi:hypothetical protein